MRPAINVGLFFCRDTVPAIMKFLEKACKGWYTGFSGLLKYRRGAVAMYMLTIKTSFAAAHNLVNYQGDCENLHGHNWKVEVTVTAKTLDKSGLGIDFKVLKREAGIVINELDHKYLNDNPAFKELSPSSENISRYLYEKISERLNNDNIKVDSVTVWESDNASARYYE